METVIALVDIQDNIIGYATKEEAHRRGLLHRAFSVFIVRDGQMLIQKRNPDKYHSGGLWSNACCSHQRLGEELSESVHRRMTEEMGFDCGLEEKFSFIYRTVFREDMIEYEYDHVFVGNYDGDVEVNPEEASEIRWVSFGRLREELLKTPERFSSWFLICAPRVMELVPEPCEDKKASAAVTLDYYDRHAGEFASDTKDIRFTQIQDRFLQHLAPGALILDFGCGSGRDSRYFLSKGYRVEACDGSQEMVRIASQTAGIRVRQMLFGELAEEDRYDGIFACASILHVPSAQLPDIFARMGRALKAGGILYVSFKYGTYEGLRSGRYFTDLTEGGLRQILDAAASPDHGGAGTAGRWKFGILETWISGDARPGREKEKWLNALLRKEVL